MGPRPSRSRGPARAAQSRHHFGARSDVQHRIDRAREADTLRQWVADLPAAQARAIEAAALKTVKQPAEGKYLGDWREGEKIAQNGRGMTWTDQSAATSANGGNGYNCHQISQAEISFGTLGPSLYRYGKLRGVTDPAGEASRPIVEDTWNKLWNAKAYNACSGMPRFGHAKLLDEAQLKHLMALILDPNSPVNR